MEDLVYVAWVNDMILGIYKDKKDAELRLDRYRRENSYLDWKFNPRIGWSAELIARFRAEKFIVQ